MINNNNNNKSIWVEISWSVCRSNPGNATFTVQLASFLRSQRERHTRAHTQIGGWVGKDRQVRTRARETPLVYPGSSRLGDCFASDSSANQWMSRPHHLSHPVGWLWCTRYILYQRDGTKQVDWSMPNVSPQRAGHWDREEWDFPISSALRFIWNRLWKSHCYLAHRHKGVIHSGFTTPSGGCHLFVWQ